MKTKVIRIASIVFLLGGAVLIGIGINWNDAVAISGIIGVVIGTLGSIFSIFIPTSYVSSFDCNDWESDKPEEDYSLCIPAHEHGQGKSPQTLVYKKEEEKYIKIEVASNIDQEGNIIISANSKFSGKIKIS